MSRKNLSARGHEIPKLVFNKEFGENPEFPQKSQLQVKEPECKKFYAES